LKAAVGQEAICPNRSW